MVSGKISDIKVNWGRWPCGCCGKGVGSNSILCNKCKKWCEFIKSHNTNDSESSFKLEDDEVVEEVESFN